MRRVLDGYLINRVIYHQVVVRKALLAGHWDGLRVLDGYLMDSTPRGSL
jgi:hypothetical protein